MNILLIIVAYLLIEAFTGIQTLVIVNNRLHKMVDYIGRKGYKVAYDEIKNYWQKEIKKEKQKSLELINLVFILIPGLNILSSLLKTQILSRHLFKNLEAQNNLIPLSYKEKITFWETKSLSKRVEQIMVFLKENNKINLKYDALPWTYHLNEVKKLNDCTHKYMQLGVLNGHNVAIIGIPSLEDFSHHLILNNQECILESLPHNFEDSFIVYPFNICYQEDETLSLCMENIRIKQNNSQPSDIILPSKGMIRKRVRKMN